MKAVLTVLLATFVLLACDKDKFETKPQIEIKSASADVVPVNGSLSLTIRVTDKEGDVDDSVVVVRQRLNRRAQQPRSRIIAFKIPEYPDKSNVDMDIFLAGPTALTLSSPAIGIPGQQGRFEPDTLRLKLVVMDKAKNVSDTATQDVIVIR